MVVVAVVVWFRVWRITKGGNVLKTGSSDGYLYLSELVPVLMPHSRAGVVPGPILCLML